MRLAPISRCSRSPHSPPPMEDQKTGKFLMPGHTHAPPVRARSMPWSGHLGTGGLTGKPA
jgi:hypothetical protein